MAWWQWVLSALVWVGCVVAVLGFIVNALVVAVCVRLWHDDRVPGDVGAGSRSQLGGAG